MVHQTTSRGGNKAGTNHTTFSLGEFDDEDDFAGPKPSHSKKRDKEKKRPKSTVQSSVKATETKRLKKERVPLEDKLYERQLQFALELSAESAKTQSETSQSQQSDNNQNNSSIVSSTEMEPPLLTKVTPLAKTDGTEQEDVPHLELEEHKVLYDEDKICHSDKNLNSSCRGRGLKRPKYTESEDSGSDVISLSDEDLPGSDESDFSYKMTTKKSKKTNKKQKSTKKVPPENKKVLQNEDSICEGDNTLNNSHRGCSVKKPTCSVESGSDVSILSFDEDVLDSDDSDFSCKKTTKKSKKSNRKELTRKKPSTKHKGSGKPSADKESMDHGTEYEMRNNKPLTEENKIESKVLPAQSSAIGRTNIKSPVSGSIRLGLSKKAKVKPLHPSVNITQ